MIEQLNKLLKDAKDGGLAIKFRPTGGKWHAAKLTGADAQGIAITWQNGVQGFMPWHGVAVINLDDGRAPKQVAAKQQAAAKQAGAKPAARKAPAKPAN